MPAFFSTRGWKRGQGKGVLFRTLSEREGAVAPPVDWFQFGSLPRIYTAPVHVSLSAGKGMRNREASPRGGPTERVRPPLGCGSALVPGDGAAVRTLDCGEAVGRELRSGRRGAGGGRNAGRGAGREPGRTGAGRWRQEGRVPRPAAQRPHATSCSPW